MKHVARGEMMLGEKAGIVIGRMVARAKDGEAAANLFDMANGTIAFAKMGGDENPDLAELARTAQLTRDGDTIRLDAQASAAMIIKFMDQQIANGQAKREARRKAAAEKAAAAEAAKADEGK